MKMASIGDNTSDEIINFKCTACAKRKLNKTAVKYCVECQGYCCPACVETHGIFPTLESHNLLDSSTFSSSSLTTDLPEIPTKRCTIHETNLMSMFCGNHDIVACTICMAKDHRNCAEVQSISDDINNLFRRSEFEDVHRKLKEMKAAFEKEKEATIALFEDLVKSRDEAVKIIKDFRKDMESCLENLEKESLREVEKEFHKNESSLKDQISILELEVDNLKQAVDVVENSEENRAQKFVLMKAAQKNIAKAEEVSNKENQKEKTKISFLKNQNIQDCLKEQLGSVCLIPLKKTTLYEVTGIREMDIKMQDDRTDGDIHGSCITEDGCLLLADCKNKKLKQADLAQLSVVGQCELSGYPYSVCCTSANEAAVCFSNNGRMQFDALNSGNTIQLVSICKPMTATRQIKLNHNCHGICYKNENLFITDGKKSLYIYDMQGNKLKTVSNDVTGSDIFGVTCQLSPSMNGDRIYIADSMKGAVVVDITGKHIKTLTCTDVTEASGICNDDNGNIFVCGKTSNNVIQIAEEGNEKLGEVVSSSDGINNSFSITFDPQRCTLIVTQCKNNKLKLFDLQ